MVASDEPRPIVLYTTDALADDVAADCARAAMSTLNAARLETPHRYEVIADALALRLEVIVALAEDVRIVRAMQLRHDLPARHIAYKADDTPHLYDATWTRAYYDAWLDYTRIGTSAGSVEELAAWYEHLDERMHSNDKTQ